MCNIRDSKVMQPTLPVLGAVFVTVMVIFTGCVHEIPSEQAKNESYESNRAQDHIEPVKREDPPEGKKTRQQECRELKERLLQPGVNREQVIIDSR